MRHLRRFRPVLLFAGCCAAFAGVSCSDANDDSVGRACKAIVGCSKNGGTMGDCLDAIGGLTVDCLDCFSDEGCDYPSCQRIPGCRVPPSLVESPSGDSAAAQ